MPESLMNLHDLKLFAQVTEDHWDHKAKTFVPPGYTAAASRLKKQGLICPNPTNQREVKPTQAGKLLANAMVDMLMGIPPRRPTEEIRDA